jgi:hypothetical protein
LWKWIKKEYTHNKCWTSKIDLKKYLENRLKEMIENKDVYIGTMKKELERLKSAFDYYKIPFIWDHYLPKKTS